MIWIASCRDFQSNAVLHRLETPCSISEFVSPTNSLQTKTQTPLSCAHRWSSKRSNTGKKREIKMRARRFPAYATNLRGDMAYVPC